jgi:hypothetical protein
VTRSGFGDRGVTSTLYIRCELNVGAFDFYMAPLPYLIYFSPHLSLMELKVMSNSFQLRLSHVNKKNFENTVLQPEFPGKSA